MLSNMASMVLLVLLFVNMVGSNWVNDYKQKFTFNCPKDQSINRVSSRHSNRYEDRRWSFSCHETSGMGSCRWQGWVTEWDLSFSFQCPGHGVIGGIESYFNNTYKDRRFQFFCCKLECMKLDTCRFSGYVNSWDEYFNYNVPTRHVLRGASSHHNNGKQDRRWKFETCTLREAWDDE